MIKKYCLKSSPRTDVNKIAKNMADANLKGESLVIINNPNILFIS